MAEIITDSALNNMIENFHESLNECTTGVPFTGIDQPGLSSIIATIIRVIEKGITSAFEPVLVLVEMVKNLITLPADLIQFVSDWAPVFSDPIGTVIEFLLQPLIKNIVLPLPSIPNLIGLLLGTKTVTDIDWSKSSNILLPPKVKALDEDTQKKLIKLLEIPNYINNIFVKFILMPLQMMIEFFVGFITKVADALNPTKIVEFITDWVPNPVNGLMTMFSDIFGPIIANVGASISGATDEEKEQMIQPTIDIVTETFQGNIPCKEELAQKEAEHPALKKITGFLMFVINLIVWVIGFLPQLPQLLFSI